MKRPMRLTLLLLLVTSWSAWAQVQSTCAQKIRLASSTYEQGRLHELENILQDCKNSSNRQEQVQAYKLLTLAYIYLEEPEKADESMLKLLAADPFFDINPDVDPAEFIALYGKFRTKPLFRIALKAGPNAAGPALMANQYVIGDSKGNGKYTMSYAFTAGLSFEKELLKGPEFVKRLTIAPELMYSIRKFNYGNPKLFQSDQLQTPTASQVFNINQSWLDLNAIVQYKLQKDSRTNPSVLNPYVGIGPGFSYLLNSAFPGSLNRSNGFAVTGANVDNKSSYHSVNYNLVITAGVKYKFGSIFILADARANIGLSNMVNPASRSNAQFLRDYGWTPPDARLNTYSFTVGLQYPYFNPKKLIK